MLTIIIGLALLLVSSFYIYRTAKQNGHNATKWTVISVLAGLALELIIPIVATTIYATMKMTPNKTIPQLQEEILMPALIITIICMALHVAVIVWIMKRISGIVEEAPAAPSSPPPPPPEDFGEK